MPEATGYEIDLQVGSRNRTERIDAMTHHCAIRLAQKLWPEGTVVAVRKEWVPVGECSACRMPIFQGDSYRHRHGSMRCSDCG